MGIYTYFEEKSIDIAECRENESCRINMCIIIDTQILSSFWFISIP